MYILIFNNVQLTAIYTKISAPEQFAILNSYIYSNEAPDLYDDSIVIATDGPVYGQNAILSGDLGVNIHGSQIIFANSIINATSDTLPFDDVVLIALNSSITLSSCRINAGIISI